MKSIIQSLLALGIGRLALASFAVLYIERASAAGIRDGLVGYWPFDERTGQVASDASGLGQPGTLINFTNDNRHWVAGQIAGALEFGGTNSRECVRIPDFIRPTHAMSFSAWVYADSYSQWATIANNFDILGGAFSMHTGYSTPNLLVWSAETTIDGITRLNYIQDPQPLPLGSWNHVGFVADGAHIRMWRNGSFVGEVRYNGTINNRIPHLDIGGRPDAPPAQLYWDGKIDDVGFWTRALSFTEMRQIYLAGLAGRPLTSINSPTVSPITNRTLTEDAPPLQIAFTVSDSETPAAELSVGASSSNPSVIKDSDLVISGATSARTLTLNLVPDAHGTTAITVIVTDGGGFTASTVFTVVVLPQNDPPLGQSQTITIAEDSVVAITLRATDVDGDVLRFTTSPPQFGEATYADGVVRYTPSRDFVGADSFTFTASDAELQSQPATVTINITAVNDAPVVVATLAPVFVPPFELPNTLVLSGNGSNAIVHFDASGSSDVDNSLLQFSWFVQAESFAGGALASRTFPVGSHTVSVGVNDGELTSTASLTFDVIAAADSVNLLVIAINNATLPRREQRPLIATLKGAISALDRGDTASAVAQLEAFARKLQAQVDPAEPFVQPLQTAVQQIIDVLSAD